jgi:hypothetical protein
MVAPTLSRANWAILASPASMSGISGAQLAAIDLLFRLVLAFTDPLPTNGTLPLLAARERRSYLLSEP